MYIEVRCFRRIVRRPDALLNLSLATFARRMYRSGFCHVSCRSRRKRRAASITSPEEFAHLVQVTRRKRLFRAVWEPCRLHHHLSTPRMYQSGNPSNARDSSSRVVRQIKKGGAENKPPLLPKNERSACLYERLCFEMARDIPPREDMNGLILTDTGTGSSHLGRIQPSLMV